MSTPVIVLLAVGLFVLGWTWLLWEVHRSTRFWRREREALERRKAMRILEQYNERQRRAG
jgi:hypothetical protein